MIPLPQNQDRIAILGAGSWGTTLAWLFSSHQKLVALWTQNPEKAYALNEQRTLLSPVPVTIPAQVEITSDLEKAVHGSQIILFCCTSQSMRQVAQKVAPVISRAAENTPVLVSAAKGLELSSLSRMSQVLADVMPDVPICTLSGPNLAVEILKGMPTASVIGCHSEAVAGFVQHHLNVPTLRLYSSTDLAGVELGGTLKNIIAIAAGCSDGLDLGANSKAALMTRGLAEMTRLAVALGARASTLAGLSGMGDLFATCISACSRNYRLGMHIAHGQSLLEALVQLKGTAEGVPTTQAVCELSQRLGLQLPIAEQVEATLKGKNTPRGAIMALMSRPLASE